jgi:hypothetical protein
MRFLRIEIMANYYISWKIIGHITIELMILKLRMKLLEPVETAVHLLTSSKIAFSVTQIRRTRTTEMKENKMLRTTNA